MNKILLTSLLSVTILSNTILANNIPSNYTSFNASRLQSAFPHTLSKDGSLLIEEKLTATDYASILFSLTNIQNNNPVLKNKIANTFTGYTLTSEFLFVKPNGSVISAYDYKDGMYAPSNKIDIASVAQYSIAFHSAIQNIDKFNANAAYQKSVNTSALKHAYNTSSYILNTMYEKGKFFDDAKKEKVDYKTMANGLVSFGVLWDLEKDGSRKKELVVAAKEIYDMLSAAWNENYTVFDFTGDGTKVKFDLRDFGLFLWGTQELSSILAENGYGYEALDLMTSTDQMVSTSLVDQVTYKKEGIVREIEITNGLAKATKDEVNTGRLHTFLYGFLKWNESPFTKVIGTQDKNFNFAKDIVLYSIQNHMDDFALIHDTLFTDPSIKNDAKETPYLTWFMITADYIAENHTTHLSDTEIKQIYKAIDKNYNFLINTIYQPGKSINEKLGF